MRIAEAHAGRERIVEALGNSQGTDDPVDYNVLTIILDDVGVEWYRQYYERWGTRWNEASAGEVPVANPPSYSEVIAPWFESMADAGLMFYDASAGPICGPTRFGIDTGRYSFRTGFDVNIRDPGAPLPAIGVYAPTNELFLAEYLKSKLPHYQFAHFDKYHMADQFSAQVTADAFGCPVTPPNVNLSHYVALGYDYSYSHAANIGGQYTWWPILNGVVQAKIAGDATSTFTEATYPTAVFEAAARAWISARGNNPWYLTFRPGPPHSLFRIPPFSMLDATVIAKFQALGLQAGDTVPGTVQTNLAMAYEWVASMQATDEACRRVYESLTPAVKARTVVIITGDNGTTSEAIQRGFNHSKRQIYWGGTRVPFVIRGPMVKGAGERVHSIIATQDIFDTVTDLLRVPRAPSVRDSVSLMPLINGSADRTDPNAIRDYVYVALGTNALMNGLNEQWAMYDGRYRTGLMAGLASTIITDELADPFEETDVSDEQADRKAAMIAAKVALVGS